MYQFYYAHKAKEFVPKETKMNIRDHFQVTAIRPTTWEEHCLECSAPDCFESCMHYQARSDGRCKRFDNGMLAFAEEKACCGQGIHVKFRKWGNMMTILFPAMMEEKAYKSMWRRNQLTGKMLEVVERMPLSSKLRFTIIRTPEFIRRKKLRKLTGLDNHADAFLFHGYSYGQESYNLILEILYKGVSQYKNSIAIKPGENLTVIRNMPPACAKPNSLVKLYPENNLEAEMDILWCDFVQGKPVDAEKPADKVKCVVWDLDGTLWDGTLIETEDPNVLSLKPGIRELMEHLDGRGILQSVASKNDHSAAMAVLERLGVADYFLYPQIHWEPKSGSVEQIARELNIGIDSLVFVDDTVFERQQVASVWPQVRTYDASEIGTLLERAEFDVPVTAESRERRKMYQAEAHRNAVRGTVHTDMVDFLRRCNLKLKVFEPGTDEELLRCFELVVRTNQLNMTGKKYTREEFDQILDRENHRNFAFSCGDDFGEYGIVGFVQYRVEADSLVFTEFAMSCRVAGKFVESALFAHLLEKEGCAAGNFAVIKTKKNSLLRNTLEQIGFKAEKETEENIVYSFDGDLLNHTIVRIQG